MVWQNKQGMNEIEKQAMINRMASICKNCKHIEVNDKIKRFWCKKFDMVMFGITLNCPKGFELKAHEYDKRKET